MATVEKRGDKYRAIYKDANGDWKKVMGYTDKRETLKLAQRLEDEAHKVAIGDVDPQAQARRIERSKPAIDHLAMYRADLEAKGRHPNHVNYVIKDCERCLEFTKAATAAALTRPLVSQWQAHCLKVGYVDHRHLDDAQAKPKPDSRKTVNRRLSSVRAWLRYLANIGAIDRCVMEGWDMLDTAGHATKKRRALTKTEAGALIAKCPDDNRRELYRFALLTGLRRSECASMTPAAFDFTNKTIFLSAKDAKRKTENQILPMPEGLVKPLQTLCQGKASDNRLFRVPGRTEVVPTLHADCRAAGVDTKDVDFHALRHTFCSLLAAEGIRPEVLMKLARHKDLSTTVKYYVHFRPDTERDAINRITLG